MTFTSAVATRNGLGPIQSLVIRLYAERGRGPCSIAFQLAKKLPHRYPGGVTQELVDLVCRYIPRPEIRELMDIGRMGEDGWRLRVIREREN